MEKPQKLIDANVVKLFFSGTEEEKRMIVKLYPEFAEFDFEKQKWDLMLSIFREHQKHPNKTYPTNYNGKFINFCIMTIEDEQN